MTRTRRGATVLAFDELDGWCRTHLGAGVAQELFRAGHLSAVVGVRLASETAVVVKIRPRAERLEACDAVHRALYERGFPCPQPLVGLRPFGERVASAEVYVGDGEPLPAGGRFPAPFAGALARLVALAPGVDEVGSLSPPLPWTAPDHTQPDLWPRPDDRDLDLNAAAGPGWLDHAGWVARLRLAGCHNRAVIGHGDWYTANLRWAGSRLRAAFDWDSVIAAPEPVVAGLAAAVYPATRGGTEATIAETEAFLDAYAAARGRPFTADEMGQAWAAGLWNRSFDAKKQFAAEGRPRSLTEEEAEERCRRAERDHVRSPVAPVDHPPSPPERS